VRAYAAVVSKIPPSLFAKVRGLHPTNPNPLEPHEKVPLATARHLNDGKSVRSGMQAFPPSKSKGSVRAAR
jgi:hypothetical protein